MKYILYARKSSENKEKQALSISDQVSESERYASFNDIDIYQTLQEAKSAYKPNNRPVFNEMLSLLREGKADAILTWKPDRLCRNPEEGGKLLQMLQDGQIKEIRTATGDVYTQESDHLVLQIHFGMSNQYSRNLSQNVKRGLSHKAERGEYPKPAPIGYDSVGNPGQKRLAPNPQEAIFIKELFERASTGIHSLNKLRHWLNDTGLRTKHYGNKFSKFPVWYTLNNTMYYGEFSWNGQVYQGTYEPLINRGLFDKVQLALGNRSKPKRSIYGHWINGLIKCGGCGCSITTTVKKKYYPKTDRTAFYTYHHCTKKKEACLQAPVSATELQTQLERYLGSIRIDHEEFELGLKLFKAKHAKISSRNESQQQLINTQVELLTNKINRAIEMRADKELTKEEFLVHKNKIQKELNRAKKLQKDNHDTNDNWLSKCEEFLDNALYAHEVLSGTDEARKIKLIKDVGSNLLLDKKKLQFSFKKPYDVLLKPSASYNWLGNQDSNLD